MIELDDSYQPRADLLKDRVVLVTGAGDGIGRCAAKTYAQYGATVILCGRTLQKLEDIYDEIVAAEYPTPAIYPINFDGATEKDYDDMAATIEREFGTLHGLLHNASLLGPRTPISTYDAHNWRQVMQVNLNAPFMMTQALLSVMEDADDASIIFTSSGVGRQGRAYWGAYSVSKFGLESLTQILADELDGICNIRVNSLNPGATRTGMRAAAYPAENPATVKTPDEIMGAYLYLMGPDSKGQSGQQFDAQPPHKRTRES